MKAILDIIRKHQRKTARPAVRRYNMQRAAL
jgi:hypothetical protein